MKKYIFIFLSFLSVLLTSCGGDDDICVSGEATPRMKLKFKSPEGKLKTMEYLAISVVYSDTIKTKVFEGANVDSVFVPLRVDTQPYTQLYVKSEKNGPESQLKISYTTKSEYVSPACGIKRLYENCAGVLENPIPVSAIETNQNQITSEDKTHFYLIF